MSRYFPPLDKGAVSSVKAIQRLMVEDESFLDDPKCPYDPDTVGWLKALIAPPESDDSGAPIEDFEKEATVLYRYFRALKPTASEASSKAALDYTKVAATILDKLLTAVERAKKVKEITDFQQKVMDFMADILTPEQRTLFMDRVANDIH